MRETRWLAKARDLRRLTTLLSLLAVLFLSCHAHADLGTAQVSKECACAHGSRSEMGLAPVAVVAVPCFTGVAHEIIEPLVVSHEILSVRSIRAPPRN